METLKHALLTILFNSTDLKADTIIAGDIKDNFPHVDLNDDFNINDNVVVNNIYVAFSFRCFDNSDEDYANVPIVRVEYICVYGQNDIEIYME